MKKLLLVMLGGAIGSGARWLVGLGIAAKWPTLSVFGTLLVNVLASFAMGIVTHVSANNRAFTPERRAFVASGLIGGFTTYAAFNQETIDFLNSGAWTPAFLYIASTTVLCLAAGFGGMAAARTMAPG